MFVMDTRLSFVWLKLYEEHCAELYVNNNLTKSTRIVERHSNVNPILLFTSL